MISCQLNVSGIQTNKEEHIHAYFVKDLSTQELGKQIVLTKSKHAYK